MSLASKLKTAGLFTLAADVFFIVTGVIFLVLLPLNNYPPHLALLGVFSLVTAYFTITKKPWAKWLIGALAALASVFSLVTLFSVGIVNWLLTASLIVYLALDLVFSAYLCVFKENETEVVETKKVLVP